MSLTSLSIKGDTAITGRTEKRRGGTERSISIWTRKGHNSSSSYFLSLWWTLFDNGVLLQLNLETTILLSMSLSWYLSSDLCLLRLRRWSWPSSRSGRNAGTRFSSARQPSLHSFFYEVSILRRYCWCFFLVLIEKCNPNVFLSYFVKGCNMKNEAFQRSE